MNHTEKAKSRSLQVKAGIEESELGLEIISFDEPVNTVPSANLISGEYLSSSTEPSNPSAVVTTNSIFLETARKHNLFTKVPHNDPTEATTKEPGSIIERIINSIAAISSTASPDLTPKVTTLETEPTRGSAILKLASKKPQRSRKNSTQTKPQTTKPPKRVETSTTEKPTTIIERILSSLSAIQADSQTVSSTQVGTTFNTITPTPYPTPTKSVFRVTKSTTPRSTSSSTTTSLPAQVSTSVDPLNVLEQLSLEQTLQKRTISKLLALLNTLTSTPEPESTKVVVVTPKLTTYITGTPAENLIDVPIITSSTTTKPTSPVTTTVPTTPPTVATTIKTTITTVGTTTLPSDTTITTLPPTTTTTPKIATTLPPITVPSTQMVPTLGSRLQETLSSLARLMSSTFNPVTETTTNIPKTTMPTLTTSPATTVVPKIVSTTTTTTTTKTTTTTTTPPTTTLTTTVVPLPSTTTAIVSVETTTSKPTPTTQAVIPSSLSVTTESATSTTPITEKGTSTTESLGSTISTISPPETTTDPALTVPSTLPTLANFEVSPGSVRVYSANDLVDVIDPDDSFGTTVSILSRGAFEPPTTPFISTTPFITTTQAETLGSSTTEASTGTTLSTAKVAVEITTQDISSNVIDTTGAVTAKLQVPLNQTTVSPSTSPSPTTNKDSDRSGRLLNIDPNPVSNDIQNISTIAPTKDYYIFAVLNNNTILRKRPSTYPTKETPFLVYGVYPNNTVVQKFPNGTVVPMEPVIRVTGFDTRPNPPFLPEITSNQVTPTPDGGRSDNVNLQTVLIVNNFWWLVLLQLLSLHMSHKNVSFYVG